MEYGGKGKEIGDWGQDRGEGRVKREEKRNEDEEEISVTRTLVLKRIIYMFRSILKNFSEQEESFN